MLVSLDRPLDPAQISLGWFLKLAWSDFVYSSLDQSKFDTNSSDLEGYLKIMFDKGY